VVKRVLLIDDAVTTHPFMRSVLANMEMVLESAYAPGALPELTVPDDRQTMEDISRLTHYGVILKTSSHFVREASVRMAFRLHETHRK